MRLLLKIPEQSLSLVLNIAVKLASLGFQFFTYEQNYGFRGGRCAKQKTVGATSVR